MKRRLRLRLFDVGTAVMYIVISGFCRCSLYGNVYKSFIARRENRAYVRATYRNEADSVSSSSSWNTMMTSWKKHILSDVPLWLCDVMMMRNSSSLVFESQRFEYPIFKKKTKKNEKKRKFSFEVGVAFVE